MTTAALPTQPPVWTARYARGLLVLTHVPLMLFMAGAVLTGYGFPSPEPRAAGFALLLAAGSVQIRHSLAAARGVRPRGWALTLLLLLALAYVPLPFFDVRWVTVQWFVIASFAMLLPPRLAVALALMTALANGAAWLALFYPTNPVGLAFAVWLFLYPATILLMGGGCLYGAARLVMIVRELREAKAELAQLAVGRERLRISRDVHDLLGHTLSAVALKGELALRLLHRGERSRAVAEIDGLTAVARDALRDLMDVSHRVRPMSLAAETQGSLALLTAAGVEVRVRVDAAGLSSEAEELFAWAVREGVTNILRHSSATSCSITLRRSDGEACLEIDNDGAPAPSPLGHGLMGLAARAKVLSGRVATSQTADGQFRLSVQVSEGAAR